MAVSYSSSQCVDELAPLLAFDPDETRYVQTFPAIISGRVGTPCFTQVRYAPISLAYPVKLTLGPWPLIQNVHFRVKDPNEGIIEILELPGPPNLALVIDSYYYLVEGEDD